jgi:hypothetical protein
MLEQIVNRTDGVPLFVEELTRTVIEGGLLVDAGDRYVLDRPLPPLAIPTTLQDSLMGAWTGSGRPSGWHSWPPAWGGSSATRCWPPWRIR